MKIFIIGGTGLVGLYVVERLMAQGVDIALFNRRGSGPSGISRYQGDRRQQCALRGAFEDFAPDVVVDMVPFTPEDARILTEVCRDRVSAVVAISSIDVYLAYGRLHRTEPGPVILGSITEQSPRRTRLGAEGITYDKLGVERVLFESCRAPITVLRLPMIYGAPDTSRVGAYVKRMIDGRRHILIDSTFAHWRVSRSFTRNCAEAVALAALACASGVSAYNISEVNCLSEREWIATIGGILGWEGEIVEVSDGRWPVPFGIEPRQDIQVDSSRIRIDLGFREIVEFRTALESAVLWTRGALRSGQATEAVDYEREDAMVQSITA